MMIDEQENQYDKHGNSTDHHRCAEGWRLYVAMAYDISMVDMNEPGTYNYLAALEYVKNSKSAYTAHVRDCPKCLAVKGRFQEEVE